jgi:hypothetical protein
VFFCRPPAWVCSGSSTTAVTNQSSDCGIM